MGFEFTMGSMVSETCRRIEACGIQVDGDKLASCVKLELNGDYCLTTTRDVEFKP